MKSNLIIILFVSSNFVFGNLLNTDLSNIPEEDTSSYVGKKISSEFKTW